ncbi:hypothetical protein D1007_50367 [Hordeum vulgare]|nr:hypothetical protein D1007_50367 [Hordeum vulgare]
MVVMATKLLVQIVVTMVAPTTFRRYWERGVESTPPPPSSLVSPRWEESFPSSPWPPWLPEGRSPSEIEPISLFLFCFRPCFLALHRFLNIRRSITLIGLKF